MQELRQIRLERQIKKDLREASAFGRLLSAVKNANDKVKADPKIQQKSTTQLNDEIKHISHHCRNHKTYRKHTWPKLSTAYRVTCSVCGDHIDWIGSKHYLKEIGNQHNKG